MKKKILALVLSLAMVVSTITFTASAETIKTITVVNDDGTITENYQYDSDLYSVYQEGDAAADPIEPTMLITKEDDYIFFPDTAANNGLKAATDADTVSGDGNGLEVDKNVTQYPINEDGEYTITLEAFTTGDVTSESVTIPTDIILVIDQSDSMVYNTLDDGNTPQAAMKLAVDAFIDSVYESATTNEDGSAITDPDDYIDHRIAIVTYGSTSAGVYTTATIAEYTVVYEDGAVATLTNSVTNLPTTDNNGDTTNNSRTPTQDGLAEAVEILETDFDDETYDSAERNTVVVLLTDGVPADGNSLTFDGTTQQENYWWAFDENSANLAVQYAYDIKTTYDATVYSIGFLDAANANMITGATDGSTSVETYWAESGTNWESHTTIANRFLNFVSSNSSNAQSLGAEASRGADVNNKLGQILGWTITDEYDWSNEGYYLTASSTDGLTSVFQSIASNVSAATINLPAETQVQDYLSDYFEIPDGFDVDSDVTVYSLASTGVNTDGDYTWSTNSADLVDITDSVTIEYVETATGANEGITVQGFDFNANFVSAEGRDNTATVDVEEDFYGAKLIIQFNIVPTDGFIGGNDVITNTADSGVYAPSTDDKGEVEENPTYSSAQVYPVPDTNVVVEYDLTTSDQTVYLGNQIELSKILELDGHKVSGILNEFVNIQFSIYEDGTLDADGNFAEPYNGEQVYQSTAQYYYLLDGAKVEFDTGENLEVSDDGKTLYYVVETYDDNGNVTDTDKYEVNVDPIYYYYLDESGDEVKLSDTADDDYKALATFYIPASMSAEEAALLTINSDQTVLPSQTTTYDILCDAVPNDEDDSTQAYLADLLSQQSLGITVYVLHPHVEGTDIWVDFGTQTNIRLDSTAPINWGALETTLPEGQGNLYNANADYAPTAYYIYLNTVTGEYVKAQYQVDLNNDGDYDDTVDGVAETGTEAGETVTRKTWDEIELTYTVLEDLDINIESEKQYEIVGIQIISSDGYANISYYSVESTVYANTTTDGGSITDDNTLNVYINKYDVDITKTVTVTESEWETYQQSFIFEVSQTAYDYNEDLGVDEDATGDYTTDNDGTKYGITYREPDVTEIVMQPGDFTKSATANTDGEYTYTCTTTVTGLRAGLDAVITEDESWSWRYDLTETSVDTTITEGTTLETNVILVEEMELTSDTVLTGSSVLASGSILAAGTTVSGDTTSVTLAAGTKIATDVIIDSAVNIQSIDLDIYLSGDVTIAGESTLEAGTILEAGTTFATGTVFYTDSFDSTMTVEYVDENGETKTVALSNLITNGSYTTQQAITISKAVKLEGDVKVSGGTVLKAGTLLKAGNMLSDGTKIPADSYLAYATTISSTVTLSVGVVLVEETKLNIDTTLAKGTVLAAGTVIPDDLDITAYGTIDAKISTENVITVNYSHDLWTTGYGNDDMGLDTNKNGFNDTIVDITGDGIPDIEAFVYRDRNDDGYTDIDYLAPYVTEDEVTAGTYTNFDIPFDLDNDGFIDMLVSADAAGDDGRRLITASMTAYTTDYFVGFYINADGNIETADGTLIFNRTNKYFNGYYVDYSNYDPDEPTSAVIVGGNGGIYRTTDTEEVTNYSGSSKTFYITKAVGVDDDGDGNDDAGVGVSEVLISSTDNGTFYGTGLVIIAKPVNLDLFDRDGDDSTADEALPLLIRDTYRYINSNEYLVFTGEYDHTGDEIGDAPETGQIDTYFTNMLTNEQWLSFDDVEANEFSKLTAISTKEVPDND